MSKIFNEITTVVAVTLMLAAVSACGEKEFYNDEQYRKECYIVSGENNIFGQEYTYGENATGYLSIYLSGSTPTDEPLSGGKLECRCHSRQQLHSVPYHG